MQDSSMNALFSTTHLSGANAAYLEELYERYLRDPNSIPSQWRAYFDALPRPQGYGAQDVPHSDIREYFYKLAKAPKRVALAQDTANGVESGGDRKQVKVLQLINAYRFRGHQHAQLDPLGLIQQPEVPDLGLRHHELTEADYDTLFNAGSFKGASGEQAALRDIHGALLQTYCGSVGAEYMHITDTEEKRWLQQRIESVRSKPNYSDAERQTILERLTAAEGLEKYLHTKYVGQKRFSLEGGESLIPMLHELIQRAGGHGAKEIVIGMAHRGRLNVLVNIFGKSPAELFGEFEGKHSSVSGSGDVKYHMGFSSDVETPGGGVHLALAFNPSHLEIVGPVVQGSVRARQQRRSDTTGQQVLPITIHGDAAFIGQGVVMETLNMSQARGYKTGGTVHIVINNQVGFTTSNPEDARSTPYCTDVAKMVQAPIFHVNGDDPEAVVFVTQLAMDYRKEFGRDVVIDLVCYRRHGHNEADEPSVTQPQMYQVIKKLPTTRQLYAQHLVSEGVISQQGDDQLVADYRQRLNQGESVAKAIITGRHVNEFSVDWSQFIGHDWDVAADTRYSQTELREHAAVLAQLPEGFSLQPRVKKIMDDRRKMAAGALAMDWGFAETMAYASLLDAGYPIRISGQDSGRGTFFHRHAVLHNQLETETYIPLQHLADDQPNFTVIDSLLSEEAVLAYEYGYTTAEPKSLVIWEAQFGDFANGAQVVIDQFISSGEQKWGRLCGLVMLLPHGYDGMGPEHSSARLERYLQLCAEHNIQVCVPSTPAQCFHMLRRQMLRKFRRPLVVMTPKSLLRHKLATSSVEELCDGQFQNVIGEIDPIKPNDVTRIVLCSGKVYYDLLEKRRSLELQHVALIRVEQLYPFPEAELKVELDKYRRAKEVIWCQEEPQNQGAWYASQHHFRAVLRKSQDLAYAGRAASASPAVGYFALHVEQQNSLVDDALNAEFETLRNKR